MLLQSVEQTITMARYLSSCETICSTHVAHLMPQNEEDALDERGLLHNVLDRAALIGGDRFARDLAHALVQRSNVYAASAKPINSEFARRAVRSGQTLPGNMSDMLQFDLGAAAGLNMMNSVADPVKIFAQASPKNEFLVAQTSEDCYYVLASAYDYQSVASNQRQLLWRTRMTVNARSVSQAHALPLLVSNAAPYLARDMAEPEVMTRRSFREAQVDVGNPTVVEDGRGG